LDQDKEKLRQPDGSLPNGEMPEMYQPLNTPPLPPIDNKPPQE